MLLALICFFVLLIILSINEKLQDKKQFKKILNKLNEEYKGAPMRSPDFDLLKKGVNNSDFYLDDITWNDLDLDEVFKTINYTHSGIGEETLYNWLRNPCLEKSELNKREKLIDFFDNDNSRAFTARGLFYKLSYNNNISINEFTSKLGSFKAKPPISDIILDLIILIGIIMLFFYPLEAMLLILGGFIFQIFTYFGKKKEILPFLSTFSYLIRLLICARGLEAIIDDNGPINKSDYQKLLDKTFPLTKNGTVIFSAGKVSTSSNPFSLVFDYIRMGFHLDYICFYFKLSRLQECLSELLILLKLVGNIEAALAISDYRRGHKYCLPNISEKYEYRLKINAVIHPLINNAIPNDICIKDKGLLLTGSNASGKSTFLKTVSLAVIFAQTINTVLADSYEGLFLMPYTSMSLRDDILMGDSYYMREIKSLKRIIDAPAKNGCYGFVCLDELLKGTNTKERIAAGSSVLEYLVKNNIVLSATHDIELTDLLKNSFDNYHFEEEFDNNDISFSYLLKEGPADTSNAITLLSVTGYPDEVVKNAKEKLS